MKPSCETCVYFRPDNNDPETETGQCRRYAPRPVFDAGFEAIGVDVYETFVGWPNVAAYHWCGEWRTTWPKEETR